MIKNPKHFFLRASVLFLAAIVLISPTLGTGAKQVSARTAVTDFLEKPTDFRSGLRSRLRELIPTPHLETADFRTDRVIVKYKGDASFKTVKLPAGDAVLEKVAELAKRPDVLYAEPDYTARALFIPNDPFFSPYQWNFSNPTNGGIDTPGAWDQTDGSGVTVAVVDTGIAYENFGAYAQAPDLAGTAFVPGYDFVNGDNHPNDDEGHGTHVAGTIAQSTNNNLGLAGVAYRARLMPVKVLDAAGSGSYSDIALGIRYAADHGARVINLSLGGSFDSQTLHDAVMYAANRGVVVVAAAGNDGFCRNSYPAAYEEVIAVGATRFDESRAYYSTCGTFLDLAAPGGDLRVDQNRDGYGDGILQQTFGVTPTDFAYYFYEGTSMASPHVAGVAALLMSRGITDSSQVRSILLSTARDRGTIGWDRYYGWGIVNARAALEAAVPPTPNRAPTAHPGGPYAGTEDVAVALNGSLSSDPDNNPLTFRWDFGDSSTGSGSNPSHTYLAGGRYTVTLIVNDGQTDSAPVTTIATITEVNDPPIANAGPDQVVIDSDNDGLQTVTLSGTATDSDGTIASYEWREGATLLGTGSQISVSLLVGIHTITLIATDNGGAAGTDDVIVSVLPFAAPPETILYLATKNDGILGNLSVANEDIATFNGTAFSLYFDGSDVGLESAAISAFTHLPDGSLLLVFRAPTTIAGIGLIDDSDIVRFSPTALGEATAGSFSLYFDGSDVGLSSSSESIDALEVTAEGDLLLSTTGSLIVSGLSANDEDITRFTPTSLGNTTTGTFRAYFDGSDVGLANSSNEDVDGLALASDGRLLLSTLGAFSVPGRAGVGGDIFIFAPTTLGSATSGAYSGTLFFDVRAAGANALGIAAFDVP